MERGFTAQWSLHFIRQPIQPEQFGPTPKKGGIFIINVAGLFHLVLDLVFHIIVP